MHYRRYYCLLLFYQFNFNTIKFIVKEKKKFHKLKRKVDGLYCIGPRYNYAKKVKETETENISLSITYFNVSINIIVGIYYYTNKVTLYYFVFNFFFLIFKPCDYDH